MAKKKYRVLYIPKSGLRYRAGKLHRLILEYDKLINSDNKQLLLKVDLIKYNKLLKEFTDVTDELKRERANKRVDKERLDTSRRQGDKGSVGDGKSSSVGTGVSAENPFSG